MRHILAPILLLVFLFPAFAHDRGTTIDDLVIMNGLYYKKFTDVPFTGKVKGKEQGSFRNGKRHGPFSHYYDNGKLWRSGTYKDGKKDGPLVSYYDNGQIQSKGTYKDGKRHGPWVGYNEDGTVYEYWTGTFKDGVKVK